MSKLFERLLESRGIREDFLQPHYDGLADPFLLPDMEKAVERILQAVKAKEHILIYGDYDVDGITSSTVMEEALKLAGAKQIEIMLPDRFVDGYGMSPKLVTRAKKDKVNLVITVDCGSANDDIVQKLADAGIDTVVTDHHECPEKLPEAVAVVNPKRKDYDGFRELAGVGVAFKVAMALVQRGAIPAGQEKWMLDLVLLGTICDSMPLKSENRILGYFGMKVLEKTRRAGLKELLKTAGVKKINSEAIGFQMGPRLNAAGRIKSAEIALALLRAKTGAEAAALAVKLEDLNKKRKSEQQAAVAEIEKRGISDAPVIVEAGNWHEGILGIVAGRLVENYHRPAFVLSEVEDGVLKGSGRSFGDFSLAEALGACREILLSGGGHAGAAGVKLETQKLDDFKAQICEFYKSLKLVDQERFLQEKEDLAVEKLGEVSLDFVDELKQLEPFGEGNPEPILKLQNAEILEVRKMGTDAKHLSLLVKGTDGETMRLVAFFAPSEWFEITPGESKDILIRMMENEWRGTRSVEGRIVEIL